MKFGGLSEKEVQNISEVLSGEGVPFSVGTDKEIQDFNSASMKNDLRHLTAPNISTHVLAITIEDEDFHRLSESAKLRLLDLGITDQVPAPEDFRPFSGDSIHKALVEGPRRLVAFNFKHQLILGLVLFLVLLAFRLAQ